MNRVTLVGKLERDPMLRRRLSGPVVVEFTVRTEDHELHAIRTEGRLAEICGQFLGKGQMVSLEGRLQTRRWEDDRQIKHYRTEIVAHGVEMLSGRRKDVFAAETATAGLALGSRGAG